jgi:ATP-dependent RNA helicase RhlE
VINYDLPNVPETYVHRIGRTGRAGHSGTAFSFCDSEEREFLRDINKLIKTPIPVVDEHPYKMTHTRFTPAPPQQQRGRQQQQQGGRPTMERRERNWGNRGR